LIFSPYSNIIIASSVDAEHAFSVGRLEINHLQHSTSPQTFKAQVAVGSWAKTPLYPGLSETIRIFEKQMRGDARVEVDVNEADKEEESEEETNFWS
jgi:hypothetical protein